MLYNIISINENRGINMKERDNQMKIKDEVKSYIVKEGYTMKMIAKLINKKNSNVALQNLSNKLSRETIKYSEVKKIADILGYEIRWEKK